MTIWNRVLLEAFTVLFVIDILKQPIDELVALRCVLFPYGLRQMSEYG